MTPPTTDQIIEAHAAWKLDDGPQLLDQIACEAMGLEYRRSHDFYLMEDSGPPPKHYCRICGEDSMDEVITYCTRYTTDLTSVGEFEKAHLPEGYTVKIYPDKSVMGHFRNGNEGAWLQGKSFEVNWCAAILWACAHEREQQDV